VIFRIKTGFHFICLTNLKFSEISLN